MAHEGARSSKLTFMGTKEKLLSVGFTKQSQRQFKIWDPRNLTKEVKRMDIDQAAGEHVIVGVVHLSPSGQCPRGKLSDERWPRLFLHGLVADSDVTDVCLGERRVHRHMASWNH